VGSGYGSLDNFSGHGSVEAGNYLTRLTTVSLRKVMKYIVMQGVNKYMLQRSEVNRWVQSDHILLKHQCPETLCLRAGASEM
jgi:hypothetical protein